MRGSSAGWQTLRNVRNTSGRLTNARSARPSAIRILFMKSCSSWISHRQIAVTEVRKSQSEGQSAMQPSRPHGAFRAHDVVSAVQA